jgi:hypothetical protein
MDRAMAEPSITGRHGTNYALALTLLIALVLLVMFSVRGHKPVPHYVGWPAPISGPR